METIIVSACLLGDKCRYDGKGNYNENVKFLREHFDIVPICPEQFGGMKTPRDPSEIRDGGSVISNKGKDVTKYFEKGRDDTLNIVRYFHIKKAVLADKSPSCGVKQIYNGRFNGTLIDGQGITTRALIALGVECFTIDEVEKLIDKTPKQIYEEKEKKIEEKEALLKEKAERNAEYSTIDNKRYDDERRARNRNNFSYHRNSYENNSYNHDDKQVKLNNGTSYGYHKSFGYHKNTENNSGNYHSDRNNYHSFNRNGSSYHKYRSDSRPDYNKPKSEEISSSFVPLKDKKE